MKTRDTLVLGASAGGVDALRTIAADLPATLPASVLVVLHIGARSSMLPSLLTSAGPLPAAHARDGEALESGRIYVAPPDSHMVIRNDRVRLLDTASENFTRPAIDPLFRSAAIERGPRVVGAVLTGHLDDGSAGLHAIRCCAGTTIVQDPTDAFAAGMPESALGHGAPDFVLPLTQIGPRLAELAGSSIREDVRPAPEEMVFEHDEWASGRATAEAIQRIARASRLTCPECHGPLWQVGAEGPARYRCRSGHAYSAAALRGGQRGMLTESAHQAVQALREQARLSRLLITCYADLGDEEAIILHEQRARSAEAAAAQLQHLLLDDDGPARHHTGR